MTTATATTPLSDVELLRRLVAFPSTSAATNVPIADFVCEYLDRRPGVRIDRAPTEDGAKVNLFATFGDPEAAGPDRRGLILSAHLDVVPAREPQWTSDPFTLADPPDRLVARGACDMKGFVALALNAALSFDPAQLKRPLGILLTHDEEVGSLGAERFVRTHAALNTLPRSVLVGEPTSLRVVRMHKGHVKMRIEVFGKAAHSGYPHLGVNAIERAGAVIAALTAVRKEFERERTSHSEHFPTTPFVTLNVGMIRGGEAFNIVPDRCVLDLGLRPLPGAPASDWCDRVREAVIDAVGESACRVESHSDNPAMLLAENARIHRELCEITGQKRAAAVDYASDAGFLAKAGFECALLGPGDIENAHKADEFVLRAEFERAAALLRTIIARFCEVET